MTRIIQALNECLDALPPRQLQRVRAIGVSGQMHGILFWKAGQGMLGVGNDLMLRSLNRPRTGLRRALGPGSGRPGMGIVPCSSEPHIIRCHLCFVSILSGSNV